MALLLAGLALLAPSGAWASGKWDWNACFTPGAHAPGPAAELASQASASNLTLAREAQELMLSQLQANWRMGYWSTELPFDPSTPECGHATPAELSMPIEAWRERHPGVDAFCHFENHAAWFRGAGSTTDYRAYGRAGMHLHLSPGCSCDYLGVGRGPSRSLTYDAGTIAWDHLNSCVDLIDDPYCYSLGWLKNQRSDSHLMSNYTAWKAIGRSECEAIQREFDFQPEEVTVGRHVMRTPLYFKGAYCALYGGCPSVTRREHKMHVYTKCLLGGGDAAQEMSYCHYKGCLLPGNRIGHGSECGYDA